MGLFILLFTILTVVFLTGFIKLIKDKDSNNIKLIVGIIMFTIFIICATNMTLLITNDTNHITKVINDYKSNKIKEIIIIENQDTTYKYKY